MLDEGKGKTVCSMHHITRNQESGLIKDDAITPFKIDTPKERNSRIHFQEKGCINYPNKHKVFLELNKIKLHYTLQNRRTLKKSMNKN